MIEGWVVWLILVVIAVGAVTAVVALVRLPREEGDVGALERRVEASWIAGAIERGGGSAPHAFVEEVLDLHAAYLRTAHVPAGDFSPPLPLPTRPPAPTPPGPPPGAPLPPPPGYAPPPQPPGRPTQER